MTRDDSDRIGDLFSTSSRDLTPAPARHAVHLLYAPVSYDPEVTKLCASVLSDTELQRADRFVAEGDEALFKQRRAFRRFCGALALGSSQPLSEVTFNESENGCPHLAEMAGCWFSFSSCRFGFIGAWSATHGVGVDIEDQTRQVEAVGIGRQFFSEVEAKAVEGSGGLATQQTFFQLWTLKEAALKSIGEGLPYGLDAFEFELVPEVRVVQAPPDHGRPEQFSAHMIEGTDSCAALVIRSPAC